MSKNCGFFFDDRICEEGLNDLEYSTRISSFQKLCLTFAYAQKNEFIANSKNLPFQLKLLLFHFCFKYFHWTVFNKTKTLTNSLNRFPFAIHLGKFLWIFAHKQVKRKHSYWSGHEFLCLPYLFTQQNAHHSVNGKIFEKKK